jgi:hypothetical protein
MSDDRHAFSQAALHALAARYRERLALLVDRALTLRVRLGDVRVEDDELIIPYTIVETHGFKSTAPGADNPLSAHARELYATDTLLYAGHPYFRLFFDPAVIGRAAAIVAVLPAGKTVEDDYVERPAPPQSKFVKVRAPGAVARELLEFVREQTESVRGDDLLRPSDGA